MNHIVDNASIVKLDEHLIKTVYADKTLINASHLERIRECYTELNGSEDLSKLRLIIEFKGEIEFSRDISERYLFERVRPKVGEALVSENIKNHEYLNAASAIMKTSHPVEVFSTVEEAKDWLLSLK